MPLTINCLIGGCFYDKTWRTAVNAMQRRLDEIGHLAISPLRLDVLFIIPGEVFKLDFDGFRRQRFWPKEKLLRIEVALIDEPSGDPDAELGALLRQAIDLAESYARRKGISEDLHEIREIHASITVS